MLIAYRNTPHPATSVTPYQAMSNHNIHTRLDYTTPTEPSKRSNQNKLMDQRDNQYKQKMKQERRNTKEHNFILGDYVLLKQRKHNKWSTPFEPAFYVIIKINGSSVTVRRITDGWEVCRDSTHFKLANSIMNIREEDNTEVNHKSNQSDCRESILMNAPAPNPEDKEADNNVPYDPPGQTSPDSVNTALKQPTQSTRPRRQWRKPAPS